MGLGYARLRLGTALPEVALPSLALPVAVDAELDENGAGAGGWGPPGVDVGLRGVKLARGLVACEVACSGVCAWWCAAAGRMPSRGAGSADAEEEEGEWAAPEPAERARRVCAAAAVTGAAP